MRIAVCDNHAAAAEQIGDWIRRYCALYNLHIYEIRYFTDPLTFGNAPETFDVAFMGFGGGTGLMTARQLRERNHRCKIILVDDTQEYILRGMRIHCTNFILRPVEFHHIVQSMQLAVGGGSQ